MYKVKEQYKIIEINPEELLNYIQNMKEDGYRLVQISCTVLGKGIELNYSFDREYEFINLKIEISDDKEIQSISTIFNSAFLYENELQDLFGVKIKHLSVNYNGSLYKISVKSPFANKGSSEGGLLNE